MKALLLVVAMAVATFSIPQQAEATYGRGFFARRAAARVAFFQARQARLNAIRAAQLRAIRAQQKALLANPYGF